MQRLSIPDFQIEIDTGVALFETFFYFRRVAKAVLNSQTMKSAKLIIPLLIYILLFSSCRENRLVDYTDMYIHNNLWYYNDETAPFTGTSYFNFFGDSSVVDYSEGRWDGRFIIYYANGHVDTERNYRQDVLHGPYYKGSMEGKTLVKGQYRNGKMHGTWYYYEANGKLREKIVY